MKPSILFHRPGLWQSDIESSTKVLAREFLRDGYPCAYFGQQIDPLNALRHPLLSCSEWRTEKKAHDGPLLLQACTPFPVRDIAGLRTHQWMHLHYRFSFPRLQRQLVRAGLGNPDVLWLARPGASVLKRLFPQARLVMQVVDYYAAFRGDYIRAQERRDYAAADRVFLIGEALRPYLVDELGVDAHKITVLGQGVRNRDYRHDLPCPADLAAIRGPIAIWVGVLDKADPQLLEHTAHLLQARGGSLVLIGPSSDWALRLCAQAGNVHLLGPKHPQEVPAYLMHSDIGLMLYNRKKTAVYRGQNPLKLYEYAAAGLPVLSTAHTEYGYLDAPVHQCDTTMELEHKLQLALDGQPAAGTLRAFALNHDWEQVYATARSAIDALFHA